jgi:hypothetical protein
MPLTPPTRTGPAGLGRGRGIPFMPPTRTGAPRGAPKNDGGKKGCWPFAGGLAGRGAAAVGVDVTPGMIYAGPAGARGANAPGPWSERYMAGRPGGGAPVGLY